MKKVVLLSIIILALSGCYSKLKVTVKVADRDQVMANSSESINSEITESLIILESFLARSASDKDISIDNIEAYLNKLDTAYPILPSVKQAFEDAYDIRVKAIELDVDSARSKFESKKIEEAYPYIVQAKLKIFSFIKELKAYDIDFRVGNKIYTAEVDVTSHTLINEAGSQLERQRQRFPILGDPLSSYVAKNENKEIWNSMFNKTVSRNLFGNSDIAVILRANPPENELKSGDYNNNFTVKGVRMDVADATNAFFTSLTQTMNFIASTQGLSLPPSQNSTTENPLPNQSPLVTGLQTDVQLYESKRKKLNDMRQMLIDKINQEDVQNKTGSELTASIARIEDFWSALKVEINK